MTVATAARMTPGAPAPAAAPPIIELCAATKIFSARGRDLTVFDGLSFGIAPGSFVSVIGPSGCGKSTLLKIISGLEPATAGEVRFEDRPVAGPPKGMVYVFQHYTRSIFPWLTVRRNVEFGLRARKAVSRAEARERCDEYISLVGLEGCADYYPYQLSGGMQQRVCIARALIGEPAVLLMDEPFSAVDAMTRALLQELVLKIWDKLAITILFVTHDVDEAVLLSSRIISLGRAGAGIVQDVMIDLPRPRDQIATRAEPRFTELRQRLFASIFAQEKTGASPAASAPSGETS
jgi:NitT/TauT family transport system ATP-binding protein